MPIYEFYCKSCHTIFNFFSSSVNTDKRPYCPRCKKSILDRRMSVFATPRHQEEENEDMPVPDMDESKMEQAMNTLAREAEHMDEEDPRQAAQLMRKLTDMTGMELGPGFQEALSRMEAGEDPEQVEAELGDVLEEENPFEMKRKGKAMLQRMLPPKKDETLYDL